MSSPDLTPAEMKLGQLLASYQEGAPIPKLRKDAGDLFPELAEIIECLELLNVGCGKIDDDLPKSIGRFRIQERLGSGASGVVYRARDGDRPVALKVLRDALALSDQAVKRFHREISAARALDHPHIAKVLDHGEADGHLYLVTELVEGKSLATLLDEVDAKKSYDERREVLDRHHVAGSGGGAGAGSNKEARGGSGATAYARRMAALFAPVARALKHAQEKGLVHRDVKPGNLILGRDGNLRIVDFGLAKVIGEEITSTIAVLGTPGFMSPEQASGQSRTADHRCDIYGLGATLYRALAHKLPFDGDSFGAVLAAIQTTRPAPLPDAVPRALDAIVSRCLEKNPADRYADGNVLADDLDRVARGAKPRVGRVGVVRRATRYAARRKLPIAAAGALLIVVAWWITRPAHVTVDVWPRAQIAWDGRAVGEGRWEGEVPRGEHTLDITLDRFVPVSKTMRLGAAEKADHSYHLRPRDPFDPEALAILAKAYDAPAPPVDDPPRPRGLVEAPVVVESDPGVVERCLGNFDKKIRREPDIRILAVGQLLKDGHFAEALFEAKRLANEYPQQPIPVRLVLEALRGLGLEERPIYHEFYERIGGERLRGAAPRTLALLAGCTEYANLKSHPRYSAIELYGSANDAKLLADTLVQCLGAAREDITVLAGTEPTRANILQGLDRLAKEAHAGDRVVVLLAGHGTQQPDTDGDEADGMDEVFLPCDVTSWIGKEKRIGNAISDDEIRGKIEAIRASGATVWFLLDCCHAGSGVRGAEDLVVSRHVDPETLGVPMGGGLGGAERTPLDLKGVVAMYASQSYRAAPELRLPRGSKDARWHGLFTYTLASQLRQAGAQLTFRELQARVLAAYEAFGTVGAVPLAEGDLDLQVFGAGRSGLPPLLVDGLALNAGRLAGLGEGTVLAVYEPGRMGEGLLGYVEISEAGLERSKVRAIARAGKPAPSLPPGPLPSRVEAVRMDLRLKLCGKVPAGLEGLFVETPKADAEWILEGDLLRSALGGPAFRAEEQDLRDLYRAQNLKRVASGVAPLPAGLLVKMVGHGEVLRPGDTFRLEVENGTDRIHDVNVFVLDARFGVQPLFPPPGVTARLGPREKWRSEEPFTITDTSVGVEHLVVVAVPRGERDPEVNLGWLAQKQLRERGGAEDEISRFLGACAFGGTRGVAAEAPAGVTAALLSWRTEWPQIRLPSLERPQVVVQGCADLLGEVERGAWAPASAEVRPRGALAMVYPRVAPAVVVVRTRGGHGTGFLVEDGHVLTNSHVVARGFETDAAGRPRVLVHRGDMDKDGWMRVREEAVPAEVVALDEAADLALLRVDADAKWFEGMRPLALAPSGPRPGEACYMVGHPAAGLLWTVREGQVAQVGRMPHDMVDTLVGLLGVAGPEGDRARAQLAGMPPVRIVLSDCAGNPGDSGGPLVNDEGRLLGVTYAIPRDVRQDKFVYHVHFDAVKEFLARPRPRGPLIPDPWRLGPKVALDGKDFLVAGLMRPEQILIDLDGDSPDADVAELVTKRTFEAEAAFHFPGDRRIAFYDTENDGTFDLVLVDEDSDPEADVRFTLEAGAWRAETGLDVAWLKADYFTFEGGAAAATEKFRRLTQ